LQSSVGQQIDERDILGKTQGMIVGGLDHGRAEPQAGGQSAQPREDRKRGRHSPVFLEMMFRKPDAVISQRVGRYRLCFYVAD
jgi:hypothetical protein